MSSLRVYSENFKTSIRAIRSNRVRAFLTMTIIAIGIMALVGILTAIDAIKGSLTSQFATMGANSFAITSQGMSIVVGNSRTRVKNQPYITYREAMEFRERFTEPSIVSVSTVTGSMVKVSYRDNQTNPIVQVSGVDENYLNVAGYNVAKGRNFSKEEIENNRSIVLIGNDVANALFKGDIDPIDKIVTLAGVRLRVVGVLEQKGASIIAGDNIALMPLTTARNFFSRAGQSFTINVMPYSGYNLDMMAGEAEGLFRVIRGLDPKDDSDFNISKSDQIVRLLLENIKFITLAATIIGLITLFGAAVGLMNIMLVSVTERTREIGVRKAMGAKASTIRQQFLFESVVIGQFGGIFGILLGIIIGNIIASALGTSFFIPWKWVASGVALCLLVGVASGYFPAVRASRVDPIEALRYE